MNTTHTPTVEDRANYLHALIDVLDEADRIAKLIDGLTVEFPDTFTELFRDDEGLELPHPGNGRKSDMVTVEKCSASIENGKGGYTFWLKADINGREYRGYGGDQSFRVRAYRVGWSKGKEVPEYWAFTHDHYGENFTDAARERVGQFLLPFMDSIGATVEHVNATVPFIKAYGIARESVGKLSGYGVHADSAKRNVTEVLS